MEKQKNNYYLGLDIGTDSVGYAVTNETYDLLKLRGEPMWGTTTFETAALAADRRMNRTARRRLDRKQQRVQLLSEIFAPEICKVDPKFFIRRKESALFSEDAQFGVQIFDGGLTDKEYHEKYPTIHHLILDLMTAETARDIRLVYLACAWLVANRGHFLFDVDADSISDFSKHYEAFCVYFMQDCDCVLPWDSDIPAETIQQIMQAEAGVTSKKVMFTEKVFDGKKPSNKPDAEFPFRRDVIVMLLSGGKAAPKDLFCNDAYAQIDSLSLGMDEENFDRIVSELGDDGALLRVMRGMYDCALLNVTLRGNRCISEAKVAVYNQHAADLKWLKQFIRKYKPKDYAKIFRRAEAGNYVAYSYNLKNCEGGKSLKKANRDVFSDFLKKQVSDMEVDAADRERYDDMINRLGQRSFLPKQKNTDNRVIPQQLYRYELVEILDHAVPWLPMLKDTDADGITNRDKILSIFDFRIPYFVGPLNPQSPNAWLERKAGKIYPWNFEQMVDLDVSEQKFIRRMTNTCSYLPGEDVLPYCSLLYSRYMVLNELNNLKINQESIPVAVKQELYVNLFEASPKKVTKADIKKYLKSHGLLNPGDEISGIDANVNASLRPYHCFKSLLCNGTLTAEQVEEIINHAAYSEDKNRMEKWLGTHYPALSIEDRKYILHQNLKGFGRLSGKLLTGIMGCKVDGTGEAMSIMDALWETNENLMQLLSERYTFREQIEAYTREYYADPSNRKSLSDRLSDMYISNAVKRPIIRTLDIVSDVVKATGHAPEKIFVEMARGGTQDQKGKRTISRKQQILDLYKQVKHKDVPRLMQELEGMGEMANNRLQSDRLFLYYLQLGRCMYTEEPIDLTLLLSETCDIDHIYPKSKRECNEALKKRTYNIDHIYPRSKIKDDSVLNNKVLVLSTVNSTKDNIYPIDAATRAKRSDYWLFLKELGLITAEKYNRLTRTTGFTDDELHQFINRQLVETRQSTKVVAQLLKERYPDTEVVYVKAGMVSEFRQKLKQLKCRAVNDLHHAKDAYLNIVVGNVYHEKFTRRWFDTSQEYNVSVEEVFDSPQAPYGKPVWNGKTDLAKVKKTMGMNAVHVTRYSFCRKGGLFDQMPVSAAAELTPRKKELPSEKYGGYNKPTASYYLLASFTITDKRDVMFVPVELQYAAQMERDAQFCTEYLIAAIGDLNGGKPVKDVQVLLNGRKIKTQATLSVDGMRVLLGGKTGTRLQVRPLTPLILGNDWERYVKRLESFSEKAKANIGIVPDFAHDGISEDSNLALYDLLTEKCEKTVFAKCPGNIADTLKVGRERFEKLSIGEQITCLMNIVLWFNDVGGGCDLKLIGGAPASGVKRPAMKLSSWKKGYSDVRIIDSSSSGLFEDRSENLLDLL